MGRRFLELLLSHDGASKDSSNPKYRDLGVVEGFSGNHGFQESGRLANTIGIVLLILMLMLAAGVLIEKFQTPAEHGHTVPRAHTRVGSF